MILSLFVFLAFMPLILFIIIAESAKAERARKKWQAEHIDVTYREPSPFENDNNDFIRAVNKYVVNNVKEHVSDIKVAGTMLRNVVTVYVKTEKGFKTLTLFKRHTNKGWEFFEQLPKETADPKDDDKSPKGEAFNEDDYTIIEEI